MMRRIVDATIPALIMVATVPVFVHIVDLPTSIEHSLGEALGIVWCVVVGASSLAIWVGVCFRRSRPALSFRLEFPALVVAGTISAVFGVSILAVAGWRGWTAAWFVWAIGGHFLARYLELALARRAAKKAAA